MSYRHPQSRDQVPHMIGPTAEENDIRLCKYLVVISANFDPIRPVLALQHTNPFERSRRQQKRELDLQRDRALEGRFQYATNDRGIHHPHSKKSESLRMRNDIRYRGRSGSRRCTIDGRIRASHDSPIVVVS